MKKEMNALHILVVEDNSGDQLLLQTYLQHTRIPVATLLWAQSLSEAEKLITQNVVDLAFLDLTLPDSTGLGTFAALNRLLPHTPIIILSGYADVEASIETIAHGAQDYLMKGAFDEQLLAKSIHYSIERKRTGVKLEESNERYEFLHNATKDVIWDLNLASGEVYVNSRLQEIFGYDEKDFSVDWFFRQIHPQDREEVRSALACKLNTGTKTWECEFRFRISAGAYKHVYSRGYTLYDKTGKPFRMIGSLTDTTDRKVLQEEKRRLQEELLTQQLNQQKLITETTIQAQEKWSEQLSKELHDNINQVLATVKMFLNMAKTEKSMQEELIDRSHENVNYAIEEIRKLSKSLVAPSLGDIGLQEALRELVEEICLTKEIAIELNDHVAEETMLDPGLKLVVYRIVQEQFSNILKYSNASKAVIALDATRNAFFLRIADNGIGFDPTRKAKGIGLKNIASRVQFYAGKLSIISSPGKGCALEISIPL